MSDWRIINADVLDGLRSLPDASVHLCVTSPPYYGLRSYGTEGQLGLEATPAGYLERMVAVFAEVWRVLRPDGTCWVNMGDSYAAANYRGSGVENANALWASNRWLAQNMGTKAPPLPEGLKHKDLMMMPARLALALQADGWWLRSDIIWAKRAPMPESVTDRPTSAHEHIFLLSKAERYFYDAEAVREPMAAGSLARYNYSFGGAKNEALKAGDKPTAVVGNRDATLGANMRNYWLLSPEPYAEAHFATFPTEIPRRAILAGTSERGVCSECGAPWKRVVERDKNAIRDMEQQRQLAAARTGRSDGHIPGPSGLVDATRTTGWQPTCRHTDAPTVPATVLDPFSGAGTTLLVAQRLGRRSIGIELNAEYVTMAHKRIESDPAAMNMRMELVDAKAV